MSLKDELKRKLAHRVVPVVVDGDPYHFRTISNADRDALFQKREEAKDRPGERLAWVVVYTLCDQAGQPVFTPDDFPDLMQLDASKVEALAVAGMKANGWLTEAVDAEKKD